MKLVLQKQKFLHALSSVQNVVSTRTPIGILNNLLLRGSGSSLTVAATDLDIGIRTACEAGVEKPGAVTLPARRLFSIIRELPSEELTLDVDGKLGATIAVGLPFFASWGCLRRSFPRFRSFPPKGGIKTRSTRLNRNSSKSSSSGFLMPCRRRKTLCPQWPAGLPKRREADFGGDGWPQVGLGRPRA